MTQVAGPYDLDGAIRRILPKSLRVLKGESIAVEWYLQEELPVTPPNAKGKPLPNPHGVFRVLSPITPLNSVAAKATERLDLTAQVDTIPFATGTLSYELTEQDIASITSVTGTLSGTPGHVFTPTVDYTFTLKSIEWTGTGSLPDSGTNVAYSYRHRMYVERHQMDERVNVRAILKCQAFQAVQRHYSGSTLGDILSNSLAFHLRSMAGQRLVRPDSPDETYAETISIGRVLARGPLPPDASGSLFPWFVDFTVNIGGIHEGEASRAILTAPIDATLTS